MVKGYEPAAVFVYSTCVTALIGDDLDAVCAAAAKKFKVPVIPVNAPGFVGSKNLGNRLGGRRCWIMWWGRLNLSLYLTMILI